MNRIFAITLSIGLFATFSAAAQKPKPKKKVIKTNHSTPKIDPSLAPMVGLWTMRNGEKPRLDIKMKFTPDGHFAFLGPNWKSSGTYRVVDGSLSLEWANVDGQGVKPGQMKKNFDLHLDTWSFIIDKYTYWKMGSPVVAPAVPLPSDGVNGK